MEKDEVVGDRFVVEALAGQGGMGTVYRALDRVTGERVALKVLAGGPPLYEERFLQEAAALAAVTHPAVVRYVAQGVGAHALWLAMEWLEGEDLAQRLERCQRLDLGNGLALAARAADGIAAAHQAGLVHRDLKPSNLFLVGKDPRAVKVLDFGVARITERVRPLTKTGQMIGTVGFMAPEQILGERDLDARADIFALGCLIFECVTGQPAFPGATSIAIIAKVLREEPVRPSSIEPAIPAALDTLLMSMLAKQRDLRPASAAEVAETLRSIAAVQLAQDTVVTPAAKPSYGSVTGREQRLVSVVLLVPRAADESVAPIAAKVGAAHGTETLELGEGAHLFIMPVAGAAKDQAARAGSCALALRAELPEVRIAVGTGLAEPTGAIPVGPAIDRAAALIDRSVPDHWITVDEATAGLLDDSFEIAKGEHEHAGGIFLVGRARSRKSGRPAPRNTPFVGREKEVAIVQAVLAECFDEAVPRAVVITGALGAGKSRLRRECLERALASSEPPRAVIARADVVGAGAALYLVRQIVERIAGIREGETSEKKARILAAFLDADERRGSREFLSELIGCALLEAPSAELRAARDEPRVLAEALKRSFAEFLRYEAKSGPLIVVLEDLHWGDEASIDFIAEAMRDAQELPLLVMGLARSEVWNALPRLREMLTPQEVALVGLTPRAARKLAEAVVGPTTTPDLVAQIVQRSDGNPFFIEELARSSTEGRLDTSETVLAIVQSRLQRLEPEARRFLRAASVFGRNFLREGPPALLGESTRSSEIDDLVTYLEQRDVLTRDPQQPLLLAFKHDLLRDASYATLPDVERREAHRLAAEWLEQRGSEDAAVLAEHFERSGESARAVEWLARAVVESQNAGSYTSVIALTARAVEAGATGELRGALRVAEALARAWQHDWSSARIATREALSLLPPGSVPWFRAVAVHCFACVSLGDTSAIDEAAQSVTALADEPEPSGPYGFALFVLILIHSLSGHRTSAEALLERLNHRGADSATDPGFVAWRAIARAHVALSIDGEPGHALRHLRLAAQYVPALSDSVARALHAFFTATALHDSGDSAGAARMSKALAGAPGLEAVPYLRSWTKHVVGRSLLGEGKLEEALEVASSLEAGDDALFGQRVRSLLAQTLVALGRVDEAEEMAAKVVRGTFSPQDVAIAHAVDARVKLRRGDLEAALQPALRAHVLLAEYGCASMAGSLIYLTRAQIVSVLGPPEDARLVVAVARERIRAIASGIDEPALREAWLSARDNAKTLTLASSLCGPD